MANKTIAIVLVGLALVGILFFSRLPGPEHRKLIGQPSPPLEWVTKTSKVKESLSALKGKVVLVNFWASWCAPCIEEMPSLAALEAKLSKKSFELVAINVERSEVGLNSSLPGPKKIAFALSPAELRPYHISVIPLSVLVDRTGIVRKVYLGPREWDSNGMIKEINTFID